MTFTMHKRLQEIDKRAAQLKRRYGKDRSTWPPEALARMSQISERRQRVFSLMGKGGK